MGRPSSRPSPDHVGLVHDGAVETGAIVEVLEESRALGFLGPGPVMFHVEHARGFGAVLPADAEVLVDLGTGGGVPGLVLAHDRPDSRMILVDGSTKRCEFLEGVVERLGWTGRVEVRCGRAEEIVHDPTLRGLADAVVSRSFGPPAAVAECGAPFLRVPALTKLPP